MAICEGQPVTKRKAKWTHPGNDTYGPVFERHKVTCPHCRNTILVPFVPLPKQKVWVDIPPATAYDAAHTVVRTVEAIGLPGSTLLEAERLVNGERAAAYGPWEDNARHAATIFFGMTGIQLTADDVTKLSAVCVAHDPVKGRPCGRVATRSYRIPDRDTGELVQVGSAGVYVARCRVCWSRGS